MAESLSSVWTGGPFDHYAELDQSGTAHNTSRTSVPTWGKFSSSDYPDTRMLLESNSLLQSIENCIMNLTLKSIVSEVLETGRKGKNGRIRHEARSRGRTFSDSVAF